MIFCDVDLSAYVRLGCVTGIGYDDASGIEVTQIVMGMSTMNWPQQSTKHVIISLGLYYKWPNLDAIIYKTFNCITIYEILDLITTNMNVITEKYR